MKKINNGKVRVCVAGINGRMGHELIKVLCNNIDGINLTAGLDNINSTLCGVDIGELVGLKKLEVIVHDNLINIKDDFDILIDFTRPEATLKHLAFCLDYHKNMVIGTTGFTNLQKLIINKAAQQIGIVLSSNFSIGINVMLIALQTIVKIMGKSVDIDIIDIHHRRKLDSPSGTALTIKECIINSLGGDDFQPLIYNCMQQGDIRASNSIGMSAIRTGDVIGEHIVMFSGKGERLEITHKASNRMIYAIGAARAALWLNKNKIGLFNMLDVLGLTSL
ncbi:4-hydroxy-tetrahydrodipicolinate reductase [Blochmannia endosymbiont of Camponotus (Colobopsis) obliquus]|uniref:4-hydroxy-tetrahydrodipicolinate reductase n=1 Tax=Blochmannia endosymbiont of Camponotus (Colobopsis) obliquus TaxID=1505597 RepID=UPI00061A6CAE|nr:4-hydroxy-tetrahydrodipicolinate reductase [Blochmannia endosymbiont of Camponotus (Colobopsis) obliquus]AKC60298.1 dihydrodipicolinate reductase [Blochmannia endosymbiont of Camponotus (Colobopsis) obliquus]